ncbi:MAG: TIGR02757 family protein [Bacteroidales bacterium]|jgi:uncharacterized protein (TIGR02757 family)|nr:TIGR02757 family protein [Bacteroidales bacterium]
MKISKNSKIKAHEREIRERTEVRDRRTSEVQRRDLKNLEIFLDENVHKYNTPAFIENDPVQFPRRYTKKQDIEIVAFLVAHISWGKRAMILRDAERMLSIMGDSPYNYVMDGKYEKLGNKNVHRTFFEHDMKYFLGGFAKILKEHNSIEDFLNSATVSESFKNPKVKAHERGMRERTEVRDRMMSEVQRRDLENLELSPWEIARLFLNEMITANNGAANKYCLPTNPENSALKRINMALRWLVRNDGIVDMGIWNVLKPAQLYIPLDVHVANVSRELGLLKRSSNDRKAVEELTGVLREFCPDDPVKYDFALFGAGISA